MLPRLGPASMTAIVLENGHCLSDLGASFNHELTHLGHKCVKVTTNIPMFLCGYDFVHVVAKTERRHSTSFN